MKLLRVFFIFGIVMGLVWYQGCKPREGNDPKISENEPSRSPRLVVSPPGTMDFTSTQRKPPVWAPTPDDALFFNHARPDEQPPFQRGHVKFDRSIQVHGKDLDLKGATVRKFEMTSISLLTIYTVGFYAPPGEDFSTETPDVERALILEYHLDVPKEKVVEAIKESVYANPDVKAKEVEANFNKLSDAFDSPRKGDRYEFVYLPGKGTAMIKSGKILTIVPTREFSEAFFGIWLSPHGNDLQMRCELLALPCPKSLNPVNVIASNLEGAKEKLGKLKKLIP